MFGIDGATCAINKIAEEVAVQVAKTDLAKVK